MTLVIIVVIVVVVLIIIGLAVWQQARRRRTAQLHSAFGPEYDRAKDRYGGDAESVLAERKENVEKLEIHPLSDADRDTFTEQWVTVQAEFVDDPGASIGDADRVITEVMNNMGYPAGAFQNREEAASVNYPDVAENYRQAHEIAERQKSGDAGTEDLREAMLLYRSLFEKLVGTTEAPAAAQT